jgi:hypothetical protein
LGTGIGFEVSRLDFDTQGKDLSSNQVIRSTRLKVDGKLTSDWLFEETMLEDHCVSVATRADRSEQVGDWMHFISRMESSSSSLIAGGIE